MGKAIQMTVAQLTPKPTLSDQCKDDVIAILKAALAQAEAGETEAICVIALHPDKSWSDKRSMAAHFPDFIGRLQITLQAWINAYLREPK
jgi:hypothetical protein